MSPPGATAHAPPANPRLEMALLGELLNHGLIADVRNQLGDTGAAFYEPFHGQVYQAVVRLHKAGRPVDADTVRSELNGHLRGPQPALFLDLLSAGGLSRDAGPHAGEIARLYRQRRLLTALDLAREKIGRDPERTVQAIGELAAMAAAAVPVEAAQTSTWRHVDPEVVRDGAPASLLTTILCRDDGVALLYPGRVNAVYGEPTGGKTWLALLAGVHQLNAGHNVLFIDYEDRAASVYDRLRILGISDDVLFDPTRFRYVRVDESIDAAGARAALVAELTELQPSLVIIDGVGESMSLEHLNPYDNPDTVTWWAKLPRFITRHGCEPAVMLIDHVAKDKDSRGGWAIGAQAKVAAIDGAAYMLVPIAGELGFAVDERGSIDVSVAKDRHGAIGARGQRAATMILDSHDGIIDATLAHPVRDSTPAGARGSAAVPTYVMEQVSRWVEDSPGASKTMIEMGVAARSATIREALNRLVNGRYLSSEKGPRKAVQHYSIFPYRQGNPLPRTVPGGPR